MRNSPEVRAPWRGWNRVGRALAVGLVALGASLVAPREGAAQDPSPQVVVSEEMVELRLADGSIFYGRVVEVAGTRVVLVTEGGARVELNRAQIRSVQPFRGELRDGQVWQADPNITRLFFGPTGRTIAAGEGYLGVFELFFPFAAFAPTDNILLAAGTPIMPEMMGEILYLAPKVRVLSTPGADVSVGGVAMFVGGDSDLNTIGVVYGAGTVGSPNRAATFGAGWGFSDGEFNNKPIFMAGGEQRVSRRVKLMTENYLFIYDDEIYEPTGPSGPGDPYVEPTGPSEPTRVETRAAALLSGGLRLFGERLSADLGIGAYFGDDSFCCVPLVNFVYSF